MVGRSFVAPPSALWNRIVSGCALAALLVAAGCGSAFTPEQKAAMNKVHFLGGKLSFKDGGYRVDFQQTPIEDKDLETLAHIGNITSLDLRGTRITDGALKYIEPIKTLEAVKIQRTGVTREGAEQLRKNLPNTQVEY